MGGRHRRRQPEVILLIFEGNPGRARAWSSKDEFSFSICAVSKAVDIRRLAPPICYVYSDDEIIRIVGVVLPDAERSHFIVSAICVVGHPDVAAA